METVNSSGTSSEQSSNSSNEKISQGLKKIGGGGTTTQQQLPPPPPPTNLQKTKQPDHKMTKKQHMLSSGESDLSSIASSQVSSAKHEKGNIKFSV